MHLFGLLISILSCYIFYKKKSLKEITKYTIALLFVTYFFFNIGNFFFIGNTEILYFEFFLYVFFILNFILLFKTRITKKQMLVLLVTGIAIIANNIALIYNPTNVATTIYPHTWHEFLREGVEQSFIFSKYTIVYDIYFFMLPISFINIKNNFCRKDFFDIIKFILPFGLFCLGYSLVEFIVKFFIDPMLLSNFRNAIFGITDFTVLESIQRNGIPAILGFCREPSSFAYSIFVLELIIFTLKNQKQSLIYLCIGSIAGFLSGSFGFIILFFISIIIYLFRFHIMFIKRNIKKISIFSFIGIAILILLLINMPFTEYYVNRFINVISILDGNYENYTSEFERIYSSLINLNVFLSRPLLGAGLGTTYSFSAICSLLANFGLVGLSIIIYSFYTNFIYESNINNHFLFYLVVVSVVLIFFIFGSGINTIVYSELMFYGIIVKCLSSKEE